MRILVAQTAHDRPSSECARLLDMATHKAADVVLLPEDYFRSEVFLEEVRSLMDGFHGVVASGLFNRHERMRYSIILGDRGDLLLRRPKTTKTQPMPNEPLTVDTSVGSVGILLCREIFCSDIRVSGSIQLLANPIGVGMYGEEQVHLWCRQAQEVAQQIHAPVVGVSHADGSFVEGGPSIPIAFAYNSDGTVALRRLGAGAPVVCEVV